MKTGQFAPRLWLVGVVLSILAAGSTPLTGVSLAGDTGDLQDALAKVKAVGPKGAGNAAASNAWAELSEAQASSLPTILTALDDANPLAANWLRSLVDSIGERELAAGRPLPLADFESFVLDQSHAPRSRAVAYQWLLEGDPAAADRLVPGFLHDPSVEFRRLAVARLLTQAESSAKDNKKDDAKSIYTEALSGARDLDQVEEIANKLKELGQEIDLNKHFGFITKWWIIGPFDNVGGKGYAQVFPPEATFDPKASYDGKTGPVLWQEHASNDPIGVIDFNKALVKASGVTAYAYAEFESPVEREADFRVVCICACKLWLNGQLIDESEVYHSGAAFDQYVSRGKLLKGKNTILVKVCQNEQTEEWAQDWRFKLRVCDASGTAILSGAAVIPAADSAPAKKVAPAVKTAPPKKAPPAKPATKPAPGKKPKAKSGG